VTAGFDRQQHAFWDSHSSARRPDHPAIAAFARQRVAYLGTLFRGWTPATALDVGCGNGVGMVYMQPLVGRVYGCDRSASMLRDNPAPRSALALCEAGRLPYRSGAFDVVYCWELLHHVGDPHVVVREMTRVARTAVLLCEPNSLNPAMALFGIAHSAERGLLRFTPSYTRQLLADVGLRVIDSRTAGCIAPNRMPASVARALAKLPYPIPVVGMSTISLGLKQEW
jgi:2-polyprenyl-3-methyl-5-hydroxy-6-metoxy-1,4-benzoquinol methylase